VKTFNKKGLEKWIGYFWFLNHSLKWFLVVPPKNWFALFETKLGESKKRRVKIMCGWSLKIVFWKFEKSPWEHYISKKYFIFEISSYTFKVVTTKFSWKFTMFKSPFIFLKHSRKACGQVVFLYQKSFPLSNVHQIISIFLWN
jgi:hypothetical protein